MQSRGATLQKVTVPFDQPVTYTAAVWTSPTYTYPDQYFWSKETKTADDYVWIPTLSECDPAWTDTNIWVRDLPPDFTDTSRQFQGDGFTSYKNAVELYDDINKALTRVSTIQVGYTKLDVDDDVNVMFMFAL
jgi:hypothetical protein